MGEIIFRYIKIILFGVLLFSVLDNSTDIQTAMAFNTRNVAVITGLLSIVLLCESLIYKLRIKFSVLDYIILLWGLYLGFNYWLNDSVAHVRLIEGIGLFILYFLLRCLIRRDRNTMSGFLLVIVASGLYESITGFRQLYGFAYSNHSLFKITGTFFNPGPYAGYLAVIFSMAAVILIYDHSVQMRLAKSVGSFKDVKKLLNIRTALYYTSFITCVAIFIILPATISRASWLAALIPIIIVCYKKYNVSSLLKQYKACKKTLFNIGLIALPIIIILAVYLIFNLKKDSANGRLLMWNVELRAIGNNPLSGSGIGYFGEEYADAQASYLSQDGISENTIQVAGCPEYGFNEYLQTGVESGIIGLALILFLTGFIVFSLSRQNRTIEQSVFGGFIALAIFALFSYPLSLVPFRILTVFFAAVAASLTPIKKTASVHCMIISVISLLGSIVIYYKTGLITNAYTEWRDVKMLYGIQSYNTIDEDYGELYPFLCHDFKFMFEYGHTLNKLEFYEKSNKILQKGKRLSSDPMFWNIMGNNYKMLGNNKKAEECYTKSFSILPNRLYPLHLLTKLYYDTKDENFNSMADKVLEFYPKVNSTAIKEMKNEIRKLLEDYPKTNPKP